VRGEVHVARVDLTGIHPQVL